MLFIKIIFCLFFSAQSLAQELPKLATKQSPINIRYISKDGKFTYYTSLSGSIQLSTNYSFSIILKSEKNTQYNVEVSDTEKQVMIEKIQKPHSKMEFLQNNDIYISKIGADKVEFFTKGKNPKLHYQDTWTSYFNSGENKLYFVSLLNRQNIKPIKLNNKTNPYYIPKAQMISPSDFLYTDVNKDGHEALLHYSSVDKKSKIIYKTRFSGARLDLCQMNNAIYIGEFPQIDFTKGSRITKVDLFNNENFIKKDIVYSTDFPDIGNMNCKKNKIYFIKTMDTNKKLNLRKTSISYLDTKTNKITSLKESDDFTQLITLGNMIVSPKGRDFYIVNGEKLAGDDSIKMDKGAL